MFQLKKPYRKSSPIYLLAFACIFSQAVAAEQIEDQAELFSLETREEADGLLRDLKKQTGVELFVETVQDTGDTPSGRYALDRAREKAVYGAYILIAVKERKIEIKVAGSLKEILPPTRVEEMRETMIAAFREENFDSGLLELARTTANDLEDVRVQRPHPAPLRANQAVLADSGKTLATLLASALLFLALTGRLLLPLIAGMRNRAAA